MIGGFRSAVAMVAAMGAFGVKGNIGRPGKKTNGRMSELERKIQKRLDAEKIRSTAQFSSEDRAKLAALPPGREKRRLVKELKREYGVL